MNDLTHLFKVGQKVIYRNNDFDAVKRNIPCVVKETYPDHIIITDTDTDTDLWIEEGLNMDCVFPLYSNSGERLIALTDGTGMGDEIIIFRTDAPTEELKALEKASCEAYINDDDVPVWTDILAKKGYVFQYIAEHQHITPYGTSKEWLEREYPHITEHYMIENQPKL